MHISSEQFELNKQDYFSIYYFFNDFYVFFDNYFFHSQLNIQLLFKSYFFLIRPLK